MNTRAPAWNANVVSAGLHFFGLEEKKNHKTAECISLYAIGEKKSLLRQQIGTILTEISNICSLLGRDSAEPYKICTVPEPTK